MSQSHNKRLLWDILAEDGDADFRGALLDHTLHFVRRKRRWRMVRKAAYGSLMLLTLVFVSFHFLVSKPTLSKRLESQYVLVTTHPFPANAVVATGRNHSVATISSSPTIEFVSTANSSPELHQLDDDELLALLPSSTLIVRRGPHLAEIVFAEAGSKIVLPAN